MTGYRVSLSGAQMASSDLTNAWSGPRWASRRAVRAGIIVRAQHAMLRGGRPLKLDSKDFPVVSTVGVVLIL